MRNLFLAVTAAAGLVGCVGGVDTPSTPPPGTVGEVPPSPAANEARKQFEDNVFPVISAKCGGGGCHSLDGANATKFVGSSKTDAYITAVGYQALIGDWTPAGAPILTKVAPGHSGQTYTPDEKTAITNWLTKELEARSGGGPTTTPSGESPAAVTARLTGEWSGCMTLANFQTANMKAWGNMRADNSACKTCHVVGEFGNIASDTDNPFFTIISTNKYYMVQYFTVDFSQGVAAAKVIVNTKSFAGVAGALAPHTEHPRFTVNNSTGMVALQKFYDLTLAAKTAGTCGPPTLKP